MIEFNKVIARLAEIYYEAQIRKKYFICKSQ